MSLVESGVRFARETLTLKVALNMIREKFLQLIPAIIVFMLTTTGKFVAIKPKKRITLNPISYILAAFFIRFNQRKVQLVQL